MNIVFIDNRNYINKTDIDSIAREFIMLQNEDLRDRYRYVPSFSNAYSELAPHSYFVGNEMFGQMLTNFDFDIITQIPGTRGSKFIGYIVPKADHHIFIINEDELDCIPEPRFVICVGQVKFETDIDMCIINTVDCLQAARAADRVWKLMNIEEQDMHQQAT